MNKSDEKWFKKHTAPGQIPVTTQEYLLNLGNIKDLVIQFPPSCVVKTKKGVRLQCPRPGRLGVVVNYSRDGKELKVVPSENDTEAKYEGMCSPEDLEVVGYWRGLNPELVEQIFTSLGN